MALTIPSPAENVIENEPQSNQVDAKNDTNIPVESVKTQRLRFFIKFLLGSLILLFVVSAIVLPAVLVTLLRSTTTTTTTSIGLTTTTTTASTTTVTCATGYTLTPSSTCVNTMIDFNNCGTVGYVCSSNYTSCSAGVCSTRPAVALAGAIPVPGFNTTINSIDDATTVVTLPLNITLYNYTTNRITVSSNGVVCLGSCSTSYSNTNLPSSSFGGPTVFGYWDDLMIARNTSQTIYYGVSGTAPNRITTFEFYESHYSSSTQYYHFQIIFNENQSNVVKCFYFDMSNGGATGTIGIQGISSASGSSILHAYNQLNAVSYNTTLTFDTNTGILTG
ncbi:hypothetical protein I4U23_011809 [Adineta vaga]|nr:hypothetical protein I4U23_011809 [Adineta vaga]